MSPPLQDHYLLKMKESFTERESPHQHDTNQPAGNETLYFLSQKLQGECSKYLLLSKPSILNHSIKHCAQYTTLQQNLTNSSNKYLPA